jgi:predicted ferric reductase
MASKARKSKTWPLIVLGVVSLVLVAILLSLQPRTPLYAFLHATALVGYLMIFFASLSSIYLRQLVRWLGRPFIETHHIISITGLVMITLHPILVAIAFASPSVFVPLFNSLSIFFQNAGRLGWYLLIVASLVAVFRKAIGRNWRYVHWLTYITFWLGTIHAILIGPDVQNWPTRIVFIALALVLVYVIIKRRTPSKPPARARKEASA